MGPEPRLDYATILRGLADRSVRFVVIGGQAVLLHGIPLFSFDFDLWVDPASRADVLGWLREDDELEVSDGAARPTPIVRVFAGRERMDLFFVKAMTNRDGVTLTLDEVLARAESLSDPAAGLHAVPVPSIDDLIALKRMAPAPRSKDEEAIRQLLAKKHLRALGLGAAAEPKTGDKAG